MKTNYTLVGDIRDKLKELPDECIQCCVTSPPYWGLRDYNVDGQIGLEESFEEFIQVMVDSFEEIKRVLKKDGTCWMNLGDTYLAMQGKGFNGQKSMQENELNVSSQVKRPRWMKPKNMCGIPHRVAFALQESGWILRQDIVWHKPNPMPESIKDRCTKAHEYIFLLTKSDKYYYNADAIREPVKEISLRRSMDAYRVKNTDPEKINAPPVLESLGERFVNPEGRNKRSVWRFPTQCYPEAHFATFPEKLPELCIKAGSKEGDIVLDPFMGSGTTAWVAQRLSRKWIGVELNPEYVKIIEKRVAQQELF